MFTQARHLHSPQLGEGIACSRKQALSFHSPQLGEVACKLWIHATHESVDVIVVDKHEFVLGVLVHQREDLCVERAAKLACDPAREDDLWNALLRRASRLGSHQSCWHVAACELRSRVLGMVCGGGWLVVGCGW
jgi:hypothetical protein